MIVDVKLEACLAHVSPHHVWSAKTFQMPLQKATFSGCNGRTHATRTERGHLCSHKLAVFYNNI